MDPSAGSSLKRVASTAGDNRSKRIRALKEDQVHSLEVPRIVSYAQPNGAEISMQSASIISTFAVQSVTTHSLVSNDFSHQAIDQALRAELEGKVIRGIPIEGFIQAAFPDTYREVARSRLQQRHKEYIAAVGLYLRKIEEVNDRSQTYESFASLVNYIATAHFAPVRMILMEGRSVKGVVDRRVPACIICTRRVSSPSDVTWEDVLVPFYFAPPREEPQSLKSREGVSTASRRVGKTKGRSHAAANKRPSTTLKLESHEILAGYALEILSASGLRQHTLAVLVDGESVSLWYFDRSGAISSADMNLSTEAGREAFHLVLGMFSFARRDDWGYVKRLFPSAWWPSAEIAGSLLLRGCDGKQQNWELANLKRLNAGARGLVGRGTIVYSFDDDEQNPGSPFALKLSWQPVSRPSEMEFFVRAQGAGVEGIPNVLAADCLANLSDGVRGHSALGIGAEQTDRQLRALVFDRVFRPLNEFPIAERPLGFLGILKQLIITHYNLCSRGRILHRDVSPNNLMWAPAERGGGRVPQSRGAKDHAQPLEDIGYLIDFDFAVDVVASTVEQIDVDDLAHTLALPFIAIDHLPPDILVVAQSSFTPTGAGRHIYRHDLESFFWSVWWILLNADSNKGSGAIADLLLSWQSPNLGKNREAKYGFLIRYEQWSGLISQRLWPEHEHRTTMEEFLNNISKMFKSGILALESGGDVPTAGGFITFQNFLRIFPTHGIMPQPEM